MKNIVCPSCGSEKVTLLENEKAVCLACDSVFNIHNYSKEFEKTTSHIDEKTVEIIQKIESIQSRSNSEKEEFERLLEKAQSYIKLGDKSKAIECAKRATEVIPEKAEGYIELYRIWTNDYSLTNCYETFLNTKESEYGNDAADAVKKALRCSDCDSDFINEVVDFQKRCVQYALSNIEAGSQKANTYINEESSKSKESVKSITDTVEEKKKKLRKNNQITGLITALIAIMIFGVSRLLRLEGLSAGITAIVFWIYIIFLGIKTASGWGIVLGAILGGLPMMLLGSCADYFPNATGIIADIFCLFTVSFILVRKLNKKRNGKIEEIVSDSDVQIKELERKYGKSQKMYEERMKELEIEKNLYNRILIDVQKNDTGKTVLNKYMNKAYRI